MGWLKKINKAGGPSLRSRAEDQSTSKDGSPRPTILIVDPDPYLSFLIQADLPEARVVEAAGEEEARSVMGTSPDLAIVGLGSRSARQMLASKNGTRIIGVAERGRLSDTGVLPAVDAVIVSPFTPDEVRRTVRSALQIPAPAAEPASPWVHRMHSWVGPARLVAVAVAGLLEAATPTDIWSGAFLALAILYAAVRMFGRTGPVGALLDVGVSTALIALTGGAESALMLLGLVAAVEAGLVLAPRFGVMAGLLIASGSFPDIFIALGEGRAPGRGILTWVLVFPMVALASNLAAKIWSSPPARDAALEEANRLLSTLHRFARSAPDKLEIGGVASGASASIDELIEVPAGMVVLGEAGVYVAAASFGLPAHEEIFMEHGDPFIDRVSKQKVALISVADLPAGMRAALGSHDHWLCAPLVNQGQIGGLLFAGGPDRDHLESKKFLFLQLARETAISVENARLFSQVRELSIDEERMRLARELHDGVAQALTHIRLELEFLARHGISSVEAAGEEAVRLSRVVDRAASEVRTMINGLSAGVGTEGLSESLAAYLRDMRGLVTRKIVFESEGSARFAPEVETQIFRIAQEGVANALRHSKMTEVKVTLHCRGKRLELFIDDDGVGISGSSRNVRGLSLKTMRERAETIGGSLEIEESPLGGTRVALYMGDRSQTAVGLGEESE